MAALDSGSSDYNNDIIDTIGTLESASTKTDWARANGNSDAIVKIETKLGVDLDGSKTDLATRLLIAMDAAGLLKLRDIIQAQRADVSAVSAVLTGTIPFDDTIPQNTEGNEVITLAFTPKAATSILKLEAIVHVAADAAGQVATALFVDSTANALAVAAEYAAALDQLTTIKLDVMIAAGSITARTYKIRIGNASGNVVLNGIVTGPASRRYGGVLISSLMVTEWQV